MKCRKCGAEYGEDVKFCTKCGASMEDEGQDSQAWTSAGSVPALVHAWESWHGPAQGQSLQRTPGQMRRPEPDRMTQGQRQKDRLRRQLMERRRLIKQQGSRQ